MKVPFSSASLPAFVDGGVLDGSYSGRSKMDSSCDFDLHFLYSQADERFFMYFLAIWISYFEKALFSSFTHFFGGSLNFWEFSFLSSLYILVISPLSDV
jgi:hypothetical protein